MTLENSDARVRVELRAKMMEYTRKFLALIDGFEI